MNLLTDDERAALLPAELAAFDAPIPTQIVSSDEFVPTPQTARQREVEARLKALGDELARHQGMTRRQFFRTSAGMAAAFVAMNDVYGPLFSVSRAEAATPELADERANKLAGQFILDGHTHFLRDDTRIETFVASGGPYAYGAHPEIDGLFRAQAGELDRTKREAMLQRIQQLIHDHAMYAPIWEFGQPQGYGPRVAESGLGLISGYSFSAPYEDVTLKAR